jgi:hypothetical protein
MKKPAKRRSECTNKEKNRRERVKLETMRGEEITVKMEAKMEIKRKKIKAKDEQHFVRKTRNVENT